MEQNGQQSNSEGKKEVFISLATASQISGYHPDYLSYLARIGKLKAQKIGRNWVTTQSALDSLNDKNVTEVSDETGKKIPVRVLPKIGATNFGLQSSLVNQDSSVDFVYKTEDQPSQAVFPAPEPPVATR